MGVVATALWQRMAGAAFDLAKAVIKDVCQMIVTTSLSA